MRIFRRLTAIVAQCALLTLSLVGSGYFCVARGQDAAHMAMADMSMPDMPSHSSRPADNGSSKNPHPDCTLPWALGAGCQSMTSCAITAMGNESRAASVKTVGAHDVPVRHVDHLRSVSRSPEPPPPRA